ncbi:MAG TPA: hypothetical protein PKA19_06445 [Bacillota bacterium]|nr:hypothetical protein [Bacillota bacterium]
MNNYLSHYSAAEKWDIPHIETVLGREFSKEDRIHVTFSEHGARVRNKGKIVHSCQIELPDGAVIKRNGNWVASPELLFLELASDLSLHRLILLGLQLCSHPPVSPSKAITTKRKLEDFLGKTPGYSGRCKALRALHYVEDGSASIMESLAYMILTLPHALGGYGLGGAVFNQEIALKEEGHMRLAKMSCFTDLYYAQAKLAVEYDSFKYHGSPLKQGEDSIRASILERQGIEVMHLSTIQLYDQNACDDFARNLAARLGKRMQIRAKKFDEERALLRSLLSAGRSEAIRDQVNPPDGYTL